MKGGFSDKGPLRGSTSRESSEGVSLRGTFRSSKNKNNELTFSSSTLGISQRRGCLTTAEWSIRGAKGKYLGYNGQAERSCGKASQRGGKLKRTDVLIVKLNKP
jgi:hypothetical protein